MVSSPQVGIGEPGKIESSKDSRLWMHGTESGIS